MRIADILDIVVIAVFLYFCILWVRQKSSRSVIAGVSTIAAVYVLARLLDMRLTYLLFQIGFTALMVAFVVVFQVDIRRVFDRLSSRRMFHRQAPISAGAKVMEILTDTCFDMAAKRTGALIVIRGNEPLDVHIRAGIPLDGLLNPQLLHSIFSTHSPGHDGAVIIEGERVKGFGVYLPMSIKATRIGTGGTRHAAAMGLAERSDAFIIVVSEERGTVSVARNGRLVEQHSKDQLRLGLSEFYSSGTSPARERGWRFITENPWIRLASVAMATVLWFAVAYRPDTINRGFDFIDPNRLEKLSLPVEAETSGQLAAGLRLMEMRPFPDVVPVLVRHPYLNSGLKIKTSEIVLDGITGDTVIQSKIILPPYSLPSEETPDTIDIKIKVETE